MDRHYQYSGSKPASRDCPKCPTQIYFLNNYDLCSFYSRNLADYKQTYQKKPPKTKPVQQGN